MSDSISSPTSTATAGPTTVREWGALALAILSDAVLLFGLIVWDCRYESMLVLLPVAGAAMAPFAMWAALHAQMERRKQTPLTITAIALSTVPYLAFAGLFLLLGAAKAFVGPCLVGACQILAFLAVQIGSSALAREGRATSGWVPGLVCSALALVVPAILAMLYMATED